MGKGKNKVGRQEGNRSRTASTPRKLTAASANAATISTSIPSDRLGPPGIAGELLVVDQAEADGHNDDEQRLKDRTERGFVVTARLSKYPEATTGISAHLDEEAGSSYFLAHPGAVITKLQSPQGLVEIRHNKRREMSIVTFSCVATSTREARQKFLDAVMPFFDYLCFKANLPLFVPLIHCRDVNNRIGAFGYVAPHPSATVNSHGSNLFPELLAAYALYREAKNAHSPYYKFLCYFKVLEGIYRHIRPTTFKKAKEKGIELTDRRKEVVPDHQDLERSVVGQPIGNLFKDRFEKFFRDRVAHYVLDSGSILNVSDYATSVEFNNELLLLEVCVRVVLDTQVDYCAAVHNT